MPPYPHKVLRGPFKKTAAVCLAFFLCVLAAALVLIFSVKPPPLSMNDLHLAWLVSPEQFFPQDPAAASSGLKARLSINPELSRLDNGVVSFSAVKPPGSYRIFCVGGSTTKGWPFHKTLSYPLLLSAYLAKALPGRKVEVINAGLMASDSVSDLELVRELSAYQPDLFLVYEGRNDAWDYPLRSGFTSRLLKAHIFLLRHSGLYTLLRNRFFPDEGVFDHAKKIRDWARVSHGQFKLYKSAFTGNLGAMRREAGGAPVVFLTQAVYRDGTPLEKKVAVSNGWLRELASVDKAGLIDIAAAFEKAGQKENLMIPSPLVHPDVEGYCLMAEAVAAELKKRGLVAPAPAWRPYAPADVCRAVAGRSLPALREAYGRLSDIFKTLGYQGTAAYYRSRAGR